jgi:hypothetical protein
MFNVKFHLHFFISYNLLTPVPSGTRADQELSLISPKEGLY